MPSEPRATPGETLVELEGLPALRARGRRRCHRSRPGFELEFTTENTKDVTNSGRFPTMAVVLGGGAWRTGLARSRKLGDVNYATMVHGEQGITLHKPLPVEATVRSHRLASAAIYDKGKAALVVLESSAIDTADDQPMFTSTSASCSSAARGGWGGDRGPDNAVDDSQIAIADSCRDLRDPEPTRRCCIASTAIATRCIRTRRSPRWVGSTKPILHGLCTYGFTGRALLHAVCDSDRRSLQAGMDGRFSSPGDARRGACRCTSGTNGDRNGRNFRTLAGGDRVVLDNGVLTPAAETTPAQFISDLTSRFGVGRTLNSVWGTNRIGVPGHDQRPDQAGADARRRCRRIQAVASRCPAWRWFATALLAIDRSNERRCPSNATVRINDLQLRRDRQCRGLETRERRPSTSTRQKVDRLAELIDRHPALFAATGDAPPVDHRRPVPRADQRGGSVPHLDRCAGAAMPTASSPSPPDVPADRARRGLRRRHRRVDVRAGTRPSRVLTSHDPRAAHRPRRAGQ